MTRTNPQVLETRLPDQRDAIGGHRAQATPRLATSSIEACMRKDGLRNVYEVLNPLRPERDLVTSKFRCARHPNRGPHRRHDGMHLIVDDGR